jgi:hypothetical protein
LNPSDVPTGLQFDVFSFLFRFSPDFGRFAALRRTDAQGPTATKALGAPYDGIVSTVLFEHLVSDRQHFIRDGEAERRGRLEIDH